MFLSRVAKIAKKNIQKTTILEKLKKKHKKNKNKKLQTTKFKWEIIPVYPSIF
jgi:hypothetical protein